MDQFRTLIEGNSGELFVIPEYEAFDIDYSWKFSMGRGLLWETILSDNRKEIC